MDRSIRIAHLLLSGLLFISVNSFAQKEEAAKSLLDKVSKTYEGFKTLQADFILTIQQPQQANHVKTGTLLMQQSTGKYHIAMAEQDLISDGKTQWMILKEEGEVQITDADPSTQTISPVNIFSFYNTGYKYVSAPDEQAGGKALQVVELTPEDAHAPYFKIKLRISKSTNLINDATFFDKGGVKYTYAISNTKANPSIVTDKFTFNKASYPGLEIVDLR